MKYIILLLFVGFLHGQTTAREGPSSIVELFATPENLQLMRAAEKVDACILRHVEPTTRPDGSIDWRTERYEDTVFVALSSAAGQELRDLILSEKTYDWKAGNGGRRPQFYLRVRFYRGEEVLNVDFCFLCHVLSLSRNGKDFGHANFSPNSDLFLQAFLKVFPSDEPLKHAAREAGVPL